MSAFAGWPKVIAPKTEKRIFQLRTYESSGHAAHMRKVQMFNQGGEVTLFDSLGFHAVFYASVLSGAHMPNLMYMTSFENMASHDAHWKAFGDAPTWKTLSSSPQYQHNVSHVDVLFMHPADYSEL